MSAPGAPRAPRRTHTCLPLALIRERAQGGSGRLPIWRSGHWSPSSPPRPPSSGTPSPPSAGPRTPRSSTISYTFTSLPAVARSPSWLRTPSKAPGRIPSASPSCPRRSARLKTLRLHSATRACSSTRQRATVSSLCWGLVSKTAEGSICGYNFPLPVMSVISNLRGLL